MYAYKFRLLFDEVEGFVRDYEILSNQTFKDFHDIIIQTVGLDGKELASFYTTDRKWEKQQEITLMDMAEDEENSEDSLQMPKIVMSDAVISDFIDDPHQRLIYEYDFLHLKTFYIELLKAFEEKKNVKYPICTNSEGELPKMAVINPLDDLEDFEVEGEDPEDEEDFYDEEDFANFDSEIEIE